MMQQFVEYKPESQASELDPHLFTRLRFALVLSAIELQVTVPRSLRMIKSALCLPMLDCNCIEGPPLRLIVGQEKNKLEIRQNGSVRTVA
jgi:hypothetical protein